MIAMGPRIDPEDVRRAAKKAAQEAAEREAQTVVDGLRDALDEDGE